MYESGFCIEMKKLCFCLFYYFIFGDLVNSKEIEEMPNRILKNPSTISYDFHHMDVHLVNLSQMYSTPPHRGFVNITLPPIPGPLFVCFPTELEHIRQLVLLSNAICRHIGYMTYTAVFKKGIFPGPPRPQIGNKSPTSPFPRGLKTTNWSCRGFEQTISQCLWRNISVEECRYITELQCGSCHHVIKGSSGLIMTPGYPVAYLYDLICEWNVEVRESHHILLIFNQLSSNTRSSGRCGNRKPFLEFTYGVQGNYHVKKRCDFKRLKNLTIPYHQVDIRFFSGLYNQKFGEKEHGFTINIEEIPIASSAPGRSTTYVMLLLCTLLPALGYLVCWLVIICKYRYKRNKNTESVQAAAKSNVPGREELERAYEFRRMEIQKNSNRPKGLRLRSNNGSNVIPDIAIIPDSESSNCFTSAFRRFSSTKTTPRSILPDILSKSQLCGDFKSLAIFRLKANLLDRYSRSDGGNNSARASTSSDVFLPLPETKFNFPIYQSTSSEPDRATLMSTLGLKETAI